MVENAKMVVVGVFGCDKVKTMVYYALRSFAYSKGQLLMSIIFDRIFSKNSLKSIFYTTHKITEFG